MAGMPFCCVWSGEDPYGERNGDRVAKACVMKKQLRKKEFVFFAKLCHPGLHSILDTNVPLS